MGGIPLLERTVLRCKQAKPAVIVLTPDVEVEQFCRDREIRVFRSFVEGRRLDKELLQLAHNLDLDTLLLVTGDCPFVPYEAINSVMVNMRSWEFVLTHKIKGLEVRGIGKSLLEEGSNLIDSFGEHGLTIFYHPWYSWERSRFLEIDDDTLRSSYNFSVDTEEDLEIANRLASRTRITNNLLLILGAREEIAKENAVQPK